MKAKGFFAWSFGKGYLVVSRSFAAGLIGMARRQGHKFQLANLQARHLR